MKSGDGNGDEQEETADYGIHGVRRAGLCSTSGAMSRQSNFRTRSRHRISTRFSNSMRRSTEWRWAQRASAQTELAAAREMLVVARIGVGYDAVDVPALTAKKIPLMVAGSANSPSVAEQAMFMMMALAKRGAELHAMVQDGQWNKRLGSVPFDLFGKTVLDRRLRPHRHAKRQALPGHGDERARLRSLQAGRRHQGRRLRTGRGPGCGPAPRRLRQHPLSQDAGNGRHVQRGAFARA